MARKSDDQTRLDSHSAIQRELRPGETVMDRWRFLRNMQRSPWIHTGFTRNQSGEIVVGAFMPKTVTNEDEWERSNPERQYPKNIAEIIVAKHRNGPLGNLNLYFRDQYARFENYLAQGAA